MSLCACAASSAATQHINTHINNTALRQGVHVVQAHCGTVGGCLTSQAMAVVQNHKQHTLLYICMAGGLNVQLQSAPLTGQQDCQVAIIGDAAAPSTHQAVLHRANTDGRAVRAACT